MKPYYNADGITIYHGDCREILPHVTADAVFADPPYGVDKAEWDGQFPSEWIPLAAAAAKQALAVTPGIVNLLTMPREIGTHQYRWTMSVRIMNSRMRGALGFGNWIPCLLYSRNGTSVYSCAQDATEIVIHGDMPDHPSPKPIGAMRWLLQRIPGRTIIDPFMGSGTTLVAAREQGRQAIGIEISERYCEIAVRRLAQRTLDFGATPP